MVVESGGCRRRCQDWVPISGGPIGFIDYPPMSRTSASPPGLLPGSMAIHTLSIPDNLRVW